jgi:hypothetical protein
LDVGVDGLAMVSKGESNPLIRLPDEEFTEVGGKDWLLVTRAGGEIEIRSRCQCLQLWEYAVAYDGLGRRFWDPLDVTWSGRDMMMATVPAPQE